MMTLRLLVPTLLVVLMTTLPITTPPAKASGVEEAREFAAYLCENYFWCGDDDDLIGLRLSVHQFDRIALPDHSFH
jgi:hypothetical protein